MSHLRQRKLKIFSATPRQTVTVFQDGSAADPDVTAGFRFDDGFTLGAQEPGTSGLTFRYAIERMVLRNSWDAGAELSFVAQGPSAGLYDQYPGIAMDLDSLVEFWAEAPTNNPAVLTPAWHLNNQAGQVRVFRGWIDKSTSDGLLLQVLCRNAFAQANQVVLVRDADQGLTVPRIAFNVEPNSSEHFYSVKKKQGTTYTAFGTGDRDDPAEFRMTLKEILEYLEDTYLADLQANGSIVGSRVFVPGDLTQLTIKPVNIVFENTGFYTAVSQLLGTWAPDCGIVIDQRTTEWRIIRKEALFTGAGAATTTAHPDQVGPPPLRTRFVVDGTSMLSATPGQPGNLVTLISSIDPQKTLLMSIDEISGSLVYCNELIEAHPTEYPAGSKLVPLQADALPTLVVDVDHQVDGGSLRLDRDLEGCATAVRITSIHQVTERKRYSWSHFDGVETSNGLAPAWNRGLDNFWRERDQDRIKDGGRDGNGIPVYKVDTAGSGRQRVYLAFADSAYGEDHAPNEWQFALAIVLTAANVNARQYHAGIRIMNQETLSDIGDGRPGLRLELLTDSIAGRVGGTFWTTLSAPPGQVADRIEIGSDPTYTDPQQPNGRSTVGMQWVITEAEVQAQDFSQHRFTCNVPVFTIHDGSGSTRQETALNPNGIGNGMNDWRRRGDFMENPSCGEIGSACIWRRAVTPSRPVQGASPAAVGWTPPQRVEVELEVTTITIRSTRFPASPAFDGLAYRIYGRELERHITAGQWTVPEQDATYEDLARRLWRILSRPNYRASFRLAGAHEHCAWLDLGIRAAFRTARFPAGSGGLLQSFWGLVQSVSVDLASPEGVVEVSFDSGILKNALIQAFEEANYKGPAKQTALEAEINRIRQNVECLQGNRSGATSPYQSDTTIRHGPRNTNVNIRIGGKDDFAHGLAPSQHAHAAGGGKSSTHGLAATETVFRDLQGNLYLVGENGEIFPATPSGSTASVSSGAPTLPQGTVSEAQQAAAAALSAWGLTPVFTGVPLPTSVVSASNGASTTTFVLAHGGLTTGEFVGGKVALLDFDDAVRRPEYPVVSNTANSVTVALITEALPKRGTPIAVWRKPSPRPNAVDFPNGGVVVKDKAGAWAVVTPDGKVHAGALNSGTNRIDAAGGTVTLGLGLEAGPGTTVAHAANAGLEQLAGALMTVDEAGIATPIPPGTEGQVLRMTGGVPTWGAS